MSDEDRATLLERARGWVESGAVLLHTGYGVVGKAVGVCDGVTEIHEGPGGPVQELVLVLDGGHRMLLRETSFEELSPKERDLFLVLQKHLAQVCSEVAIAAKSQGLTAQKTATLIGVALRQQSAALPPKGHAG